MARTATDYTDIPTATTAVQLGAALAFTKRRISSIFMKSDPNNLSNVAVGDSTVSITNGIILEPGQGLTINYGNGSEELGYWWGDVATSGENIVWTAVFSDGRVS